MHCTYEDPLETWPGMSYNRKDVIFKNTREDMDKFLTEEIHKMDFDQNDIFSIHLYRKTYLIRKK